MTAPRYILIGNPDGKRLTLFQRELANYWADRNESPTVVIVPWAEIISRDGNLDELPEFAAPSIVRLDSHGKDNQVYRLLLDAGARENPAESCRDWSEVAMPKGILLRPGLAFQGLSRVLRGLHSSFHKRPHLTVTANPLSIQLMFDKSESAKLLQKQGINVPQFRSDQNERRAFPPKYAYCKLNHGSSACGMMYCCMDEGYGLSTTIEINGQFFNTRKLRRLEGEAFQRMWRFFTEEGILLQEAISKSDYLGQNFDVRVVCISSKPIATIFRVSRHPMTNLHLGGHRGDWEAIRKTIPTRYWLDGLDLASEAASHFDSTVAGVDLLFERNSWKPYILEVNAYGNFFPGWIDAEGHSCHWHEIDAISKMR